MAEGTPRLPVVCLPGIRGDARIFEPLVELVGDTARLVPLDLPSGAPALAAARLVPRLPAGPVHLLTGSYGGLVARWLPRARVASVACVGTLPSPAWLTAGAAWRARLLMGLPDALLARLYQRHGLRSLTAAGVPERVVAAVVGRAVPATVLRARLRGVLSGHHGTVPDLPMAWIHGRSDAQVTWSPDDVRRLHPGSVVFEVDGDHFPHASDPAALWSTLCAAWFPVVDTVRGTGEVSP